MRTALALVLLLVAAAAMAQDQTVRVEGDDQEMNTAIQQARDRLDGFLALAKKPPRGTGNYRLKVKFSDANGTEHIWVAPFKQTDGGFEGVVSNVPDTVKNVRYRETVRFARQDISDWGYERGGKQVGSFTVCVMFKHMSSWEVRMYREDYGFDCRAPLRGAAQPDS